MSVKNCTDMAECMLWGAFNVYDFSGDLTSRIDKAVHMDREIFRTLGISLNIVSLVGYYVVQSFKIAPAWNGNNEEPIDLRKFRALFFDKSVLLFSPLVAGLDLFYLVPFSTYSDPLLSWNLFQWQIRLAKYTFCNVSIPRFVEAFEPIGSNIIQITNHRLNRVATVTGNATLIISFLMTVQTITSCLLHRNFSKVDAIQFAIIIASVAFGIFSKLSTTIDVGPDINNNWNSCLNCFNNQTMSLA